MRYKFFPHLFIFFVLQPIYLFGVQKRQEPLLFALYTDKKVYYLPSHQVKKLSPVFETQIESSFPDAGCFDLTQYQNGALSSKLMLAIVVLLKQTCMPYTEHKMLSKEAKIIGRATFEFAYKTVVDPANILNAYHFAYDNQIVEMLSGLEQGRMGYGGLQDVIVRDIDFLKNNFLPDFIPKDRWRNVFNVTREESSLEIMFEEWKKSDKLPLDFFLWIGGYYNSDQLYCAVKSKLIDLTKIIFLDTETPFVEFKNTFSTKKGAQFLAECLFKLDDKHVLKRIISIIASSMDHNNSSFYETLSGFLTVFEPTSESAFQAKVLVDDALEVCSSYRALISCESSWSFYHCKKTNNNKRDFLIKHCKDRLETEWKTLKEVLDEWAEELTTGDNDLRSIGVFGKQKSQEPLLFALYTDKKVYYVSNRQIKKLSSVFKAQIESGLSGAGFFDLTQYQNGVLSPKLMLAIAVLLKQTCMSHEEYQVLSEEAAMVGRATFELVCKTVFDPANILTAYRFAYDHQIISMLNGLERDDAGYAGLQDVIVSDIDFLKNNFLPDLVPKDYWCNVFNVARNESSLEIMFEEWQQSGKLPLDFFLWIGIYYNPDQLYCAVKSKLIDLTKIIFLDTETPFVEFKNTFSTKEGAQFLAECLFKLDDKHVLKKIVSIIASSMDHNNSSFYKKLSGFLTVFKVTSEPALRVKVLVDDILKICSSYQELISCECGWGEFYHCNTIKRNKRDVLIQDWKNRLKTEWKKPQAILDEWAEAL